MKIVERSALLDAKIRKRTCLHNRPGVKAALPGVSTPTPFFNPTHCVVELWKKQDLSTRERYGRRSRRAVMRWGAEAFSPQNIHTPLLHYHNHPQSQVCHQHGESPCLTPSLNSQSSGLTWTGRRRKVQSVI